MELGHFLVILLGKTSVSVLSRHAHKFSTMTKSVFSWNFVLSYLRQSQRYMD